MNSKKIHLIMPMGGAGSRFFKNGFVMPKPLIKINEKPFFYWSTISLSNFIEICDITFVVLKKHIEEFNIDTEIKKYFPNAKIVVIPELLNGAVLTSLNGIKEIADDNPIIFNDCDHMFLCNEFYEYCKKAEFDDIDGALLTFRSNDPKYSFLEFNELGNVIKTVEKKVISDYAICGAYYFKNKEIFEENALKYLELCNYNEFYMSGIYNVMADKGLIIKNFNCDMHIPFGTPDEYYEALKRNEFKRILKK